MTDAGSHPTRALSEFVAGLRFEDLPRGVVSRGEETRTVVARAWRLRDEKDVRMLLPTDRDRGAGR